MTTRAQCPNCLNRTKDVPLYRCNNCGFIGCHTSGFISSFGCWKKAECPRCGITAGQERFGYIGDYDSN